jgi:hypothetical protein
LLFLFFIFKKLQKFHPQIMGKLHCQLDKAVRAEAPALDSLLAEVVEREQRQLQVVGEALSIKIMEK